MSVFQYRITKSRLSSIIRDFCRLIKKAILHSKFLTSQILIATNLSLTFRCLTLVLCHRQQGIVILKYIFIVNSAAYLSIFQMRKNLKESLLTKLLSIIQRSNLRSQSIGGENYIKKHFGQASTNGIGLELTRSKVAGKEPTFYLGPPRKPLRQSKELLWSETFLVKGNDPKHLYFRDNTKEFPVEYSFEVESFYKEQFNLYKLILPYFSAKGNLIDGEPNDKQANLMSTNLHPSTGEYKIVSDLFLRTFKCSKICETCIEAKIDNIIMLENKIVQSRFINELGIDFEKYQTNVLINSLNFYFMEHREQIHSLYMRVKTVSIFASHIQAFSVRVSTLRTTHVTRITLPIIKISMERDFTLC